jgi:hypothetical protein
MADWATVAGSLGGATIGGGVGYLGARLQAAATKRQIEAEAERDDKARGDALIGRRTAIYQELLDHERWIATRMETGIEPLDSSGYLTWRDGYNHRYNELVLSSPRAVREAADALGDVYAEIYRDASATVPEAELSETMPRAFISHEPEVSEARLRLAEAMREDVARG